MRDSVSRKPCCRKAIFASATMLEAAVLVPVGLILLGILTFAPTMIWLFLGRQLKLRQ